jgi:putative ABC transport system permease protein
MGLGLDLRHAGRSLVARPGFAVVAVLTLGLGVGATTAMFSAVNSVLLRPLPYQDARDIVVLSQVDRRDASSRGGVSAANMRDVARESRLLTHVAVASGYGFTLMEDGRAHSVRGWLVSEGFFEAMGVTAELGRTFLPGEFVSTGANVVLLSHRTWRSRFGGAADIIGQRLILDDTARVVIGVLPRNFKYPTASEVWAPRPVQPWDDESRGGSQLHGVARLPTGATPAQAQTELDRIGADLARVYPRTNAAVGFRITSLREHLFARVESPLLLLMGAVAMVLLIAVANVAGLLLARGAGKAKEYALRGALGASSGRILRLVAVESLLLAIAGGLVGIGLAYLGGYLIQFAGPEDLPRLDEVRIDGIVLAFALVAAVGGSFLAGVAPAYRASRMSARVALSEASRGTTGGPATSGLRDRLVVGEIALALVLAIGAGLLIRSFSRLTDNQLGFDANGRLAVQVFAYDDRDEPDLGFMERSLEAIAALPGVESVGLTTAVPGADNQTVWSMGATVRFTIDDRPTSLPGSEPVARVSTIDGAYPGAVGIALRAGRTLTNEDHAESRPVALVNEAFARRHFPDRDPIGSRITLERAPRVSREIVGVLADVRPQGFESEPRPEIHLPLRQSLTTGGVTFVIKAQTDPANLTNAVQEAIWKVDPSQAIWAAQPLTDLLWDWTRQRQFNAGLLVAFAALAMALAATGVYGLTSFSVEQRVSELGIRRALGGRTQHILAMVLGHALKLALVGAGLGLVGSLALTRLLRGLLFGVSPVDVVTFVALFGLVVGVATLAALVPALRAAAVDPITVLRTE